MFALGLDVLRLVPRRPFQTREFVGQFWFVASVSILPSALVAIPFGAVIALQLGSLTKQLGAQTFTGAAGVLATLTETGPQLSVLLANLLTTADVIAPRRDGIEDILVSYPQLMTLANTVVPGDGTAHLGLVLNFFDPYVCTRGHENTVRRPADQVSQAPANTTAYCALPPGSPSSVRGSQNAPYGGKPLAVPPPAVASSGGSPSGGVPLPGLLGVPALSGPTSLAGLLGLSGAK
ncbi:ABC transporter permease [Amycolatopsis sp. NPDC050768]|uniref:ABC transporter permease n=1 Tax=Amycolatopsis sp. NPDC050768 TaxID=3154839 RepID=UPI0033F51AF7